MTYAEVRFRVKPQIEGFQILIAQLSELPFDSFVEETKHLKAYIKIKDISEEQIKSCQIFSNPDFEVDFSIHDIEDVNWNQAWEDNFKPVKISPECVIRAPFHKPVNVKYELIIEPKMSFGTGHHGTTHLMLEQLLREELDNKTVLDMGCGTGVLAILSEKLGAKNILAIDIDDWCYKNTLENIDRNNCQKISVKQGSHEQIEGNFDIVLANINRNILLDQIGKYVEHLNPKAIILLSGFYEADLEPINALCEELGLKYVKHQLKNDWVCAKYVTV
jgi:ribosomal protein L11 methyltransferase